MSEIRATDLDMVNLAQLAQRAKLAASEPLPYEIRSANLAEANVAQPTQPYEIRSANLVKVNLAASEVDS